MGHYGNLHHCKRSSIGVALPKRGVGTLLWDYSMSTLSCAHTWSRTLTSLIESKLCPMIVTCCNYDFIHVIHASCNGLEKKSHSSWRSTHTLTWEASPRSDGSHQLLSWGEAPQSGRVLRCLQYAMLSGHPVHVRGSKIDKKSWTTISPANLHSATSH